MSENKYANIYDYHIYQSVIIPTAFNYLSNVTYTMLFNKNSMWRNQNTGRSHFTPELCSWKMSCISNTKFPFKMVYILELGNWQPHSIQSTTIPLVDIQICTVYICTVYTVHIHFYSIYLFIRQQKCKGLTFVVFGAVHSKRTVVVLLHKHFSSWLSTFFNSISIITNCTYTTTSESNITEFVNNSFHFFKLAYYI
jgi:hypothetical protein